jgi:hypothetical protein
MGKVPRARSLERSWFVHATVGDPTMRQHYDLGAIRPSSLIDAGLKLYQWLCRVW